MFIVTTVVDTIRTPPAMLSIPSITAIHSEMDRRYPNRVLMDVGLVICRYGDCLKIGDGICVEGDGGAHHECLVKLVIFRPFVDEVCTGRIKKSTPEGIQVSLGFFDDITIPPYWMLRPSKYEARSGLWVWTPSYDEEGAGGNGTEEEEKISGDVDQESQQQQTEVEDNRYEMEIGAEIRFKVKSINFTQVTNTAKGMQATTTTTAQAAIHPDMTRTADGAGADSTTAQQPVRKRSISVDLTEFQNMPSSMHVVASICDDGLGLTSWWQEDGGDEEEEVNDNEEDS
jgi:DNA-directed RNA polymerase III subunit RPC8